MKGERGVKSKTRTAGVEEREERGEERENGCFRLSEREQSWSSPGIRKLSRVAQDSEQMEEPPPSRNSPPSYTKADAPKA